MGIGFAITAELLKRRIRSANDLVEALNIPVLGAIASTPRAFKKTKNGARA